jgi:hypothetical protein
MPPMSPVVISAKVEAPELSGCREVVPFSN